MVDSEWEIPVTVPADRWRCLSGNEPDRHGFCGCEQGSQSPQPVYQEVIRDDEYEESKGNDEEENKFTLQIE